MLPANSPIDRITRIMCYVAPVVARLPVHKLFAVPRLQDREALRQWLLALCEAADVLADATRLQVDDAIVSYLRETLINDATYGALHELIMAVAGRDGADAITLEDVPPDLYPGIEQAEITPLDVARRVKMYADLLRGVGIVG